MSRRALGAALTALWLLTPTALGDASVLNNIPTADTTPAQTIVFQFKSVLSDETHSQYFAGFKVGLEPIGQRFALESWISQPFEHGEPSFTIKLNLVIPF